MNKKLEDKVFDEALRIGEAKAENAKQELAEFKLEVSEREALIATCYEAIGQVKAVRMISKFANVSSLVWLKQVKDSKIYKGVPGIKTWENFCESIGVSRQKADEDILNVEAFGEEFLTTVSSLGVGYRDLRKLRQLSHDGTFTIDAEAVTIDGEIIPLDADHKEDLQAAIEKIIETSAAAKEEAEADTKAKDRILKSKEDVIHKQEKELAKLSKEARKKGLTVEEDTYIKRMALSRDAIDGFLGDLDAEQGAVPHGATPRMIAAYLETVGYLKRVMNLTHENAIGMYGAADDEAVGWVPPPLREENPHCVACFSNRLDSCQTPTKCCKGCPVACSPQVNCAINP